MMAPRNLGPEYVAAFDGLYKRLADKYKIPLYPFILDGVAQDATLNQADGMHPNPEGVEVVSWYVAMGFGQIVTLRTPPSRLAAINVELERSAWGVFRTECFPAYDFAPVRETIRERVRAGGK
jgi:uncharacterized protein with GYD domain